MTTSQLAVSFDPGLSHLCVDGISYHEDCTVHLEFHRTFDIRCGPSGKLSPDELLAGIDEVELLVGRMEEKYRKINETVLVLEYQPPLATRANLGLVRQNTFVEAFIQCWLMTEGVRYKKVSPSLFMKYFGFPKSPGNQYGSNKRLSKEKVKSILGGVRVNDHVADCILKGINAIEHMDRN